MVKKKCIFCNKPIKDFKVWEDTTTRKTHRSCWLGFREFEYRHFDFLFSKDRGLNKGFYFSPTNNLSDKS